MTASDTRCPDCDKPLVPVTHGARCVNDRCLVLLVQRGVVMSRRTAPVVRR